MEVCTLWMPYVVVYWQRTKRMGPSNARLLSALVQIAVGLDLTIISCTPYYSILSLNALKPIFP
jgi:hypothetical protein